MKVEKINNAAIVPPKRTTGSKIETLPHLPNLGLAMACGKRQSGKSVSITNLFRMFKQDKSQPYRVILVSATANSNYVLMDDLDIDIDDIFDPNDPQTPYMLEAIVNAERDDLIRYYKEMEQRDLLMKRIKHVRWDLDEELDDEILMWYNPETNKFRMPTHKYNGKKVGIIVLVDDAQNSSLFSNKKFLNICIKNRHLGSFPREVQENKYSKHLGSSMGLFLYMCVQNYSCQQGGIPKAIRGNISQFILFKTASEKELDNIRLELAGEMSEEVFNEAYEYATKEKHCFLFIDMDKKKHHPSKYRRNFDEYIIDERQSF